MSVDFTPTLDGYTGQSKLRFWCQKVLPLVYDDSLSYYELLNKIVVYLNNTIEDVSACEDNIVALRDAFVELQDYVNEVVTDLDAEIEQVIDEMIDSGEFGELLADVVNGLIANEYAETTSYVQYDYCLKDGKLYCATASTTGAWDSTKWRETTIGNDLKLISTRLYNLNAGQVEYNSASAYNNATVGKELQELNDSLNTIQNHFNSNVVNWRDYASITSALSANWSTFADSTITMQYVMLSGGYPHIIIAYKNGNYGYVWHQTQSSPIEIIYTNDIGSTWTTRNFENVTSNSITPIANANFQIDDTATAPFKYDKNERLIIIRAVIKCLNNVPDWQAIGTVPTVIGTNPSQNTSVQFMWQEYETGTYANGLIQGSTLYIKNATEVGKFYGCTISYFEN